MTAGTELKRYDAQAGGFFASCLVTCFPCLQPGALVQHRSAKHQPPHHRLGLVVSHGPEGTAVMWTRWSG